MERLFTWSQRAVWRVETSFKRYLSEEIRWKNRLIVITGARGTGKTTLMLQRIKEALPLAESLYVSVDNLYFSNHSITNLAEAFVQKGGRYLFLDEIHKYPDWSVEVKSIYDQFPELNLVLSGSSATELLRSQGDLSRRALFYRLQGLSFREFLEYTGKARLRTFSLEDLVKNPLEAAMTILEEVKPLAFFRNYLEYGYYPFFKEDRESYHQRLQQVLNAVLETDIPSVFPIDYYAVRKIKKLLEIIAEMVPFKPNVKKLSEQVGISRDSLIRYLQYLAKADILLLLYSKNKGISLLNKPEKIYLDNTNLAYALSGSLHPGTARETFFANQLDLRHKLRFTERGDFLVDDHFVFEVGGRKKGRKQIAGLERAWVVADELELPAGQKIPLYLFGFLY